MNLVIKIGMLLIVTSLLYALPAIAQRMPEDRTEAILQSMNEKVVEIKTKVEKIDDTVTKLDKATTGSISEIRANQEWLIWSVRGIAVGLLSLTIYVFKDKLFARNGNGREFTAPRK